MMSLRSFLPRESLLPVVLGFSDGIMTALTLAAGRLTSRAQPVTAGLALRIALAALGSGAFVFFIARYAELRRELIRSERQLNLTSHGRLAASHLGKAALREAALSALLSSVAALCGALVPLMVAAIFPAFRWASILAALVTLALLGFGLGRLVHGRTTYWSAGLVAGGAALSLLGVYLKIVN
jgi:predicted membrane protein (TIGR00267 family)